jgi:hypothetical protein
VRPEYPVPPLINLHAKGLFSRPDLCYGGTHSFFAISSEVETGGDKLAQAEILTDFSGRWILIAVRAIFKK